ncbi:ABC transporter permease [Helicobacter jaachi]|uniref:ABC transporter permease n=1 Tax=Helicobacter jaachi TaxID=1677920 RepID=A0A4U8TA85_9HELI|nr:ABC transporter permease [Helicobacter jaachi]TLD96751.1 ABC transporter permease [Helicobacter jaachi]
MKLKYYVLFSIFFALVLGIYVYSLESQSYTYALPFSSLSFTLPLAVWIVCIVLVFFIITLAFFASVWARDLLEEYYRKNDYDKLLSQINEQALNQPIKSRVYKRKAFGDLSKILQRFYLKPRLDSMESFNRKIDTLFEDYKSVMSGNVVDLKSYRLSRDNKFNLQNLKNKITANYKFGFQILDEDYPIELKQYAVLEILKNAEPKEFDKLFARICNLTLTQSLVQEMFKIFLKYPKAIDAKYMRQSLKNVGTDTMEYIHYAIESKGVFAPDEWIRFFEECADNDEKAEMALFYVLFELEMIDKAKERHRLHAKGEYKLIDAYLDLKSFGKNYPFDIFVL